MMSVAMWSINQYFFQYSMKAPDGSEKCNFRVPFSFFKDYNDLPETEEIFSPQFDLPGRDFHCTASWTLGRENVCEHQRKAEGAARFLIGWVSCKTAFGDYNVTCLRREAGIKCLFVHRDTKQHWESQRDCKCKYFYLLLGLQEHQWSGMAIPLFKG